MCIRDRAAEEAFATMKERTAKEAKLRDYLIDRVLKEIPYTRLNGHRTDRLPDVYKRQVTNTRMRDFYDIYILQKLHGEQLNKEILWHALVATARKRGTLEQIESGDIREILNEIETSSVMEN